MTNPLNNIVLCFAVSILRLEFLYRGPVQKYLCISTGIMLMYFLQNLLALFPVVPLPILQFMLLFPLCGLLIICSLLFHDIIRMVPSQLRTYTNPLFLWTLEQLAHPIWRYVAISASLPSFLVLLGFVPQSFSLIDQFRLQFYAVLMIAGFMIFTIIALFSGKIMISGLITEYSTAQKGLKCAPALACLADIEGFNHGVVIVGDSTAEKPSSSRDVTIDLKLTKIGYMVANLALILAGTACSVIYVCVFFERILYQWEYRIFVVISVQFLVPVFVMAIAVRDLWLHDPIFAPAIEDNSSNKNAEHLAKPFVAKS
ncbi:hypothetical protein MP638_001102 [Amoeboaphelidium occidentale]|nr:hypothetical protein MP638_001102 [Amoeboaphelidium occidentale]